MTYAEDLYILEMVIFIQRITMLLNFVLYSMRDEFGKARTAWIKNKQYVAYTEVQMCCVV